MGRAARCTKPSHRFNKVFNLNYKVFISLQLAYAPGLQNQCPYAMKCHSYQIRVLASCDYGEALARCKPDPPDLPSNEVTCTCSIETRCRDDYLPHVALNLTWFSDTGELSNPVNPGALASETWQKEGEPEPIETDPKPEEPSADGDDAVPDQKHFIERRRFEITSGPITATSDFVRKAFCASGPNSGLLSQSDKATARARLFVIRFATRHSWQEGQERPKKGQKEGSNRDRG